MNIMKNVPKSLRHIVGPEFTQIRTKKRSPKSRSCDGMDDHLQKFKDKQAAFQMDDGKPVFLKMGARDTILYQLTFGGAVCGSLYSLFFLVTLMIK